VTVTVRVVAPGASGHGVVRHAAAVAAAVVADGVVPVGSGQADLTHAQFTDALWGAGVAAAADAFVEQAQVLPRPLVVTLHDLPGADPDPARDVRRSAGYRRVVAVADAVVVSAGHEADKARALGAADPVTLPLPLPVVVPAEQTPGWAGRPTLGVLGFVYPGKGHEAVIDAAAAHPDRPAVVAAGAVSDGHDELARSLAGHARSRGVDWILTGHLEPAALAAAAAAVTVPVAPSRSVSASGSLLAWLAHGRYPLAAAGAYAHEVAAAAPGAVALYDDDTRRDALVADALTRPGATRGPVPDWPDAGAGHAALYRRTVAR
jgi:glycosyltransferase involved in cell wall biosynthesis